MKFIWIMILSLVFTLGARAQSIVGKWKTIDDESGKVKSIVKIYLKDGKLYGDIIRIYPDPGEPKDPICDKCKDYRKDKKIIGMQIISGLTQDEEEWKKDDGILDPALNPTQGIQYTHLYTPRKLRESVYVRNQNNDVKYGLFDLEKV